MPVSGSGYESDVSDVGVTHAAPTSDPLRPLAPGPRISRGKSIYCSIIKSINFNFIEYFIIG